ncbi:MAG: gamma-glutamyl-gamma-aminobutyrate hydrolase family protein [Candidatus Omnitrophica bacterium]|nr:gamma-glutamyl-gamma-aminobutyrate hydrolase family protein [Candidatus Omnitrophota bacterium]
MSRKKRKARKPIIGITCDVNKLKPFFSEFELFCDYRYIRAILRAGGIPILMPINLVYRRDISRLLDGIDGLVIVGGGDIHPSFYGEKSSRKIKPIYRGRTYFEMQLYRTAQRKKIPVLAICYGMQLLNVIYGGTLYQDIAAKLKSVKNHCSPRSPMHRVKVLPGSLCEKIFRKRSFMVYSRHHQAIKVAGSKLRITAFSEDGVAEAIEGPPRTLAVQWHPECQPKDMVQRRLFKYFVHLARIHQQAI